MTMNWSLALDFEDWAGSAWELILIYLAVGYFAAYLQRKWFKRKRQKRLNGTTEKTN